MSPSYMQKTNILVRPTGTAVLLFNTSLTVSDVLTEIECAFGLGAERLLRVRSWESGD